MLVPSLYCFKILFEIKSATNIYGEFIMGGPV